MLAVLLTTCFTESLSANTVLYTSSLFKGRTLNVQKLNAYISKFKGNKIVFDRDYVLSSSETSDVKKVVYDGILVKSGIAYVGNGHTLSFGNSSNIFNTMNDEHNQAIVKGFSISGFKFKRDRRDTVSIRYQGATLLLGRVSDCRITNCTFDRWKGTAISIAFIYDSKMSKHILGYSKNVLIRDCVLNGGSNYNSGNGINVISGENDRIANCKFSNINPSVWPGPIDLETEVEGSSLDKIYVDSCDFTNVGRLAPVSLAGKGSNPNGTVYITNCNVSGAQMAVSVAGSPCGSVFVSNMKANGLLRFATIANTSVNVSISGSNFTAASNMLSNDNVIQASSGKVVIDDCVFRGFRGTIDGWGSVSFVVSANSVSLTGNEFYDCYDKKGNPICIAVNKQRGKTVNISAKDNVYTGGVAVK